MPELHAQAPFLQVCPVPQVTLAHGSVIALPALLPIAPAAEPPVPGVAPPAAAAEPPTPTGAPPTATLMPPTPGLPLMPGLPLALPAPAVPTCAGPPLELGPPPVVVSGSLGVLPEQATNQSSRAGGTTRGPCFSQEWVRIASQYLAYHVGRQTRP